MTGEEKYPGIEVQLTGEDGNSFAIMGRVRKALKDGGVDAAEVKAFTDEAMRGNYEQLLATCCRWLVVT